MPKYNVKTYYMGQRESDYSDMTLEDIKDDHSAITDISVDKIKILDVGESYDFDLSVNLMILVYRYE